MHMTGDPCGQHNPVHFQSPSKSATDQVIMNSNILGLESERGEFRDRSVRRLGSDPDLALMLAPVDRAIHRLHGRVGEKRLMVGRLEARGGSTHGGGGIPGAIGDGTAPM